MSVLQDSLPSDVYFADFEFLNFNIQPRSGLMVKSAGLMGKILESCPTGHLAWAALKNGFDTMLKVNPKLLLASRTAKKKSDILTWIIFGIRVVLSWFRKGMGGQLGQEQAQETSESGATTAIGWNVMIVDPTKIVKEEVDEDNMGIAKVESVDLVTLHLRLHPLQALFQDVRGLDGHMSLGQQQQLDGMS